MEAEELQFAVPFLRACRLFLGLRSLPLGFNGSIFRCTGILPSDVHLGQQMP